MLSQDKTHLLFYWFKKPVLYIYIIHYINYFADDSNIDWQNENLQANILSQAKLFSYLLKAALIIPKEIQQTNKQV